MVKKKSKFRHISISNKKFYFYEIKWMDVIGDSGHASEKEFHNMKPAYMTTNAYLFKKIINMFGHLQVMMKKLLAIET